MFTRFKNLRSVLTSRIVKGRLNRAAREPLLHSTKSLRIVAGGFSSDWMFEAVSTAVLEDLESICKCSISDIVFALNLTRLVFLRGDALAGTYARGPVGKAPLTPCA